MSGRKRGPQSNHSFDRTMMRRMAVARLRLQCVPVADLAIELSKLDPPIVSDDGGPWSRNTMEGDLKWLREQWRLQAFQDTSEQKARVFMELQHVKREAWRRDPPNLEVVLTAIRQERFLLGLDGQATGSELQGVADALQDKLEQLASRYDNQLPEAELDRLHLLPGETEVTVRAKLPVRNRPLPASVEEVFDADFQVAP